MKDNTTIYSHLRHFVSQKMIKIEPSDRYASDLRAFCFFESCNVMGSYFLLSILFVNAIMLRMAFLVTICVSVLKPAEPCR